MDPTNSAWNKFFDERNRPIINRFPGRYRALVVETNDPLNMRRVRVKIPELHDSDMKSYDCPWAEPSPDFGGKKAGHFNHPCIDDIIWVEFEKGHPYSIIWVGFATPTRRKYYTLSGTYVQTPYSVNDDGKLADRPSDYDEAYLPKDGRPMSTGTTDRYGNLDISSAVGFYPIEHVKPPPPPEHDALQGEAFNQQYAKPVVNSPDKKYMLRITKYGNMIIQSDQGYHWKKDDTHGEFKGDVKDDETFEISRWKYIQKLVNEDSPNGDSRRLALQTRYGHKIECRDTGWAQDGPVKSSTRDGEYGLPTILSKESKLDLRWIKVRTKGGMLYQASDIGCDPANDEFVKRKLIDEVGSKTEQEDVYWANKDARWIRIVTRYGYKIVLDDRGSSSIDASNVENPRGNGILIKGRRTPSSKGESNIGDQRGFYWEFNENDLANHTSWGSPLGQSLEINDRYQYIMMASSAGKAWSKEYKGLQENEFLRKPTMLVDPEKTAHHLKIDHDNEYIRFKTRGGNGEAPDNPAVASGVSSGELNQGFEARDGSSGNGPWVEIVDSQHRGLWFSKESQLGIWRSSSNSKMYMWLADLDKKMVIYNNEETGAIEIYCNKDINLYAKDTIRMKAGRDVTIKADSSIRLQVADSVLTLEPGFIRSLPIISQGGSPADDVSEPTLPYYIGP